METSTKMFDVETCRRNLAERERKHRWQSERRRLEALEAARRAIRTCAPRYDSVQRVFLFGSVIRERAFRLVSDVDVAVEGSTAADYFALWRDLERSAPEWTFDLRDIATGSHISERICTMGLLVYERETESTQG